MLKRTLLYFFLTFSYNTHAAIIYYNFVGEVTSTFEANGGLGPDRSIEVGDVFNAIYTLESDTLISSGSKGGGLTNSTFTSAVTNFALYVNGSQFVNDDYRIQRMAVINGMRNGRLADWLELRVNGGRDNYLNDYGMNERGEYITSRLEIVDLTARVFDPFYTKYGMPLLLDIDDFSFGDISVSGSDINSNLQWSFRGSFTDIRSDNQITSIDEPTIPLLAILFSIFYVSNRTRRNRNIA